MGCVIRTGSLPPDEKRLHVNEHRLNRTLEYILDKDHRSSQRKVLFTFDQDCLLEAEFAFELGPDGLCVDPVGDLWAAHYGGGKLVQMSPGRAAQYLPDAVWSKTYECDLSGSGTYFIHHRGEFGLLYWLKIDINQE